MCYPEEVDLGVDLLLFSRGFLTWVTNSFNAYLGEFILFFKSYVGSLILGFETLLSFAKEA